MFTSTNISQAKQEGCRNITSEKSHTIQFYNKESPY